MSDEPRGAPAPVVPGVRAAALTTGAFAVVQTVAVVSPTGPAAFASVAWSLGMFLFGSIGFLAAFVVAAGRSRDEKVTFAGMVWLVGVAPAEVARFFRVVLAIQVAIALVAGFIRPFTALAFGMLAPMYGLGSIAWHAARHGRFSSYPVGAASEGFGKERVDGTRETRGKVDSRDIEVDPEESDSREDPDDFDQLFRRRRKQR